MLQNNSAGNKKSRVELLFLIFSAMFWYARHLYSKVNKWIPCSQAHNLFTCDQPDPKDRLSPIKKKNEKIRHFDQNLRDGPLTPKRSIIGLVAGALRFSCSMDGKRVPYTCPVQQTLELILPVLTLVVSTACFRLTWNQWSHIKTNKILKFYS